MTNDHDRPRARRKAAEQAALHLRRFGKAEIAIGIICLLVQLGFTFFAPSPAETLLSQEIAAEKHGYIWVSNSYCAGRPITSTLVPEEGRTRDGKTGVITDAHGQIRLTINSPDSPRITKDCHIPYRSGFQLIADCCGVASVPLLISGVGWALSKKRARTLAWVLLFLASVMWIFIWQTTAYDTTVIALNDEAASEVRETPWQDVFYAFSLATVISVVLTQLDKRIDNLKRAIPPAGPTIADRRHKPVNTKLGDKS